MNRMILVLGGTAEARALAKALTTALTGRAKVVTSLAGRVANPKLPEGEVRVGGFGGVEGLAQWLAKNDVQAVVDATHPFAENISANAAEAAKQTKVPLLRLERPGWQPGAGDDWHWVGTLD